MGWIRFSDDFCDNDKLIDIGPLGIAVYVAAMGFCNRKLSDGLFKKSKARLLVSFDDLSFTTPAGDIVTDAALARLVIEWMVSGDLWHESGHNCVECHAREDGGEPGPSEYLIHDYLKFQPSRAEVEAKAEANRQRVEKFRQSRKSGSNSAANGAGNGAGNALPKTAVTGQVRDTPNPNPNPPVIPSGITKKRGGGDGLDSHQSADPDAEPSRYCQVHPNGTTEKCPPCGAARQHNEQWRLHRKIAVADARRSDLAQKAAERRAEIDACAIPCDDDGYLNGRVCDHVDRTHQPGRLAALAALKTKAGAE